MRRGRHAALGIGIELHQEGRRRPHYSVCAFSEARPRALRAVIRRPCAAVRRVADWAGARPEVLESDVRSAHPGALALGLVLGAFAAAACRPEAARTPADPELSAAIAAMRRQPGSKTGQRDTAERSACLPAAWALIRSRAAAGGERLESEIAALRAAGERDDVFVLGAANLLFQIDGIAAAPAIAELWRTVDLDAHDAYVFPVAYQAAESGDRRALTLLRATLRDVKGSFYVADREHHVVYPETHRILWALMGECGFQELERVLAESRDERELVAAARLVGDYAWMGAASALRRLASSGTPLVRSAALRALGSIGHPADFDLLLHAALTGSDEQARDALWALYEYRDLRAIPVVVTRLASHDPAQREEAVMILRDMPARESLEALRAAAAATYDHVFKAALEDALAAALKPAGLTWAAYAALSAKNQDEAITRLRAEIVFPYGLRPGQAPSPRARLLEVLEQWTASGSIELEVSAAEIEAALPGSPDADGNVRVQRALELEKLRAIVGTLTGDDYPALFAIHARLRRRLSKEAEEEGQALLAILAFVGRRRYRTEPWLTDRAELPATTRPR
jgi:hypothetical protein